MVVNAWREPVDVARVLHTYADGRARIGVRLAVVIWARDLP